MISGEHVEKNFWSHVLDAESNWRRWHVPLRVASGTYPKWFTKGKELWTRSTGRQRELKNKSKFTQLACRVQHSVFCKFLDRVWSLNLQAKDTLFGFIASQVFQVLHVCVYFAHCFISLKTTRSPSQPLPLKAEWMSTNKCEYLSTENQYLPEKLLSLIIIVTYEVIRRSLVKYSSIQNV